MCWFSALGAFAVAGPACGDFLNSEHDRPAVWSIAGADRGRICKERRSKRTIG